MAKQADREDNKRMDEMERKSRRAIEWQHLFTMGESVELERIAAAIEHDEETTRKLINGLMDQYAEEGWGIRIIELDRSYQMCTKKEMYEYLIRIAKQAVCADGCFAGNVVDHRI